MEYDIDGMAVDFLHAFNENPHLRIPPLEFWQRWNQQGFETPSETDEFLKLLTDVVSRAKEMRDE